MGAIGFMIEKVLSFAKEYHMIERGSHILIGVSGGADSVCLLLVLAELQKRYGLRLTAVHVEHGIRGEDSLKDAAFTENLCRGLGVECRVLHRDAVAFSRERGMSLEEGARALRYDCFEEARCELRADKIAVAHNQNDCGETLLFHLARGTGLKGMCGILPVRGRIIRPLLCAQRQEIEAYLRARGQDFRTDVTNQDLCYSRNKIRHQVLPVLEEINAGAVEHLYRSTRYAAEAVELIEELVDKAEERWVVREGGASVLHREAQEKCLVLSRGVLSEPPLIQKSLVLRLLEERAGSRKDISGIHVEQVLGVLDSQVGRRIELPYGMEARRTYEGVSLEGPRQIRESKGCLTVAGQAGAETGNGAERAEAENRAAEPNSPKFSPQPLLPGQTLTLPAYGLKITARILEKTGEFHEIPKKTYTKWFDYDTIKDTLLLRTREREDYFILDSQGRRQSLRRYFINEKVPAESRDTLLVLAEGNHILWVPGYRISEAYKVTKDTKRILEVQVYGGSIHE